MAPRYLLATAIAVFSLSSTVIGQTNFTTNWNPLGEGCVDTAGYLSCYSDSSSRTTSCMKNCTGDKGSSTYNTCVNACTELQLGDNIGCWLQSCWNQVYSCAYQLTALSYFDGSGLAQNDAVPFYPPPSDASTGACSCNLGYVYGNLSAISTSTQGSNCGVISIGDDKNTTFYDCECCELAWPISNILNACPKSDLSGIYFENGVTFPTYIGRVQSQLQASPDKCGILNSSSTTCVNDFNFPFAGNNSYNVLTLPASSTGLPLTNSAGNAFTVFPSASLNLTVTLAPSYTSTVTPASFATASASANPQSISGTSIYGGTTTKTTATPTMSATPSATTTKSAGIRVEGSRVVVGFLGLVVVMSVL